MKQKTKKHLGALDIMIIVVVVLLIAALAVRFIGTHGSEASTGTVLEHYIVSFKICGIRHTSAEKFMEAGTSFYLDETGDYLGTLRSNGFTVNDAKNTYELTDGSIVSVTTTGEDDLYKVDVACSFDTEGRLDSNGNFLLNGTRYLGVNKEVKIVSKYLSVTGYITDISKAE